jgi:hypothetical protein
MLGYQPSYSYDLLPIMSFIYTISIYLLKSKFLKITTAQLLAASLFPGKTQKRSAGPCNCTEQHLLL